jgi:protein-disulfide isomerase
MSKQFLAILAVIIVIFAGIVIVSGNKSSGGSQGSAGTPTQHIEGQGRAGVTLVEYGDYECPFCGQYYPIVKQVQAEFNQQIFFQFRNFPLTSVHPNAFAGARAAEAAGLENKFWEMHDLLYQDQNQWSTGSDPTPFFNQYAQQLGLNVTQFKADYSSSKVNDLINADMAEGTKLNINATPTFFLDGKKINVGESASAFETLINAEIAKKAGKASSAPSSAGTTSQTTQPAPAKQ